MPIAEVKLPDGRIAQFNVAEGTTPEQVIAFATEKFKTNYEPISQAANKVAQGVTLGLADEIKAGVAALSSAPFTSGLSLGEAYNQALAQNRQKEAAFTENNPILSPALEIGGGLLTGIGGAGRLAKTAPETAAKIGAYSAANPVKAGALGAALQGGIYGFNTGEGGLQQRGVNAAESALVSAPLGAIGGAIASKIAGKNAIPTAEDVRSQANKIYDLAQQKGGFIPANYTDEFLNDINKFKPQTTQAQNIFGDSATSQLIDKFQTLKGQPVSLKAYQELDENLGDAIDGYVDAMTGKLTKEGKKLFDIQTALRKTVDKVGKADIPNNEGFQLLSQGRDLWKQQAKLRDIEKIVTRAELSDQPATAIRSGFRTLLSNPNRLRGYNKQEVAMIKEAAKTGIVTDSLRLLSSRLPAIVSAGSGNLAGAAALQGAGMINRDLATQLQLNKVQQLTNSIAGGGQPLNKPVNLGILGNLTNISGILGAQ